jgi:hypothetical protein
LARGRLINTTICQDKRITGFSNDTSRLAYTWLYTFADRDGRVQGDPTIVISMVFPRRREMTEEEMATYITEWQAANLIDWYEVNGESYIQFSDFKDSQKGMRYEKEAASIIPASTGKPVVWSKDGVRTDLGRSNDGVFPPEGMNDNYKNEGNYQSTQPDHEANPADEPVSDCVSLLNELFPCAVNPTMLQTTKRLIGQYGEALVREALVNCLAQSKDKQNLGWCASWCANHKNDNKPRIEVKQGGQVDSDAAEEARRAEIHENTLRELARVKAIEERKAARRAAVEQAS